MLTQDTDGALHVLRAAADGTTTDVPVNGLRSAVSRSSTRWTARRPSASRTAPSVRTSPA
ncbi:hypothetical protein [Streptomyces regalis]|uniref:Uncharacterized protein n=1 Tax=Streptomyces regalis TaxID=68262 RepID=A0A117MMW0_9ACTN|nr:hypothetical protein [Streptomyces regalis]KUL26079.1 hypothetical protein ADL12_33340 [Streptomyces regalis]